jgi:hypothetical protein
MIDRGVWAEEETSLMATGGEEIVLSWFVAS